MVLQQTLIFNYDKAPRPRSEGRTGGEGTAESGAMAAVIAVGEQRDGRAAADAVMSLPYNRFN